MMLSFSVNLYKISTCMIQSVSRVVYSSLNTPQNSHRTSHDLKQLFSLLSALNTSRSVCHSGQHTTNDRRNNDSKQHTTDNNKDFLLYLDKFKNKIKDKNEESIPGSMKNRKEEIMTQAEISLHV